MTQSLHPLEITGHIRDSYLRYLKTIYPFQDDTLKAEFAQALERPNMIVKGPLLEASPPFKTGRTIQQLIDDGILHPDFQLIVSDALPLNRPLYLHQDEAITKIVAQNRNLIVSTGTGSGKTETFLIPILNHLLQERAKGKLSSGVRALLLYPMNALANDQLKRLRKILANFSDITFGRYTGETKQNIRDAEESFQNQFPEELRIDNELISRDQMQESPPHILLTNYAMLEYLLLRPVDNVFFDGATARHWRFIVVDEAHVYNGATGIEIAMLLRRLKDRIVASQKGQLTCLATSATLGKGREDFPEAVKFTTNLFDESFEWDDEDTSRQDVVEATRENTAELGTTWGSGTPELYIELADAIKSNASSAQIITTLKKHHLPQSVIIDIEQAALSISGPDVANQLLFKVLRGDQHLHQLRSILSDAPNFIDKISQSIFPNSDNRDEALIALVELAVKARPDKSSNSLLPARYHLFARALEGAFVCLSPENHSNGESRLFLSRQEVCPHCGQQVFELATCKRCGTSYIVGEFETTSRNRPHLIQNSTATQKNTHYFVLEQNVAGLDEDEAVVTEDNDFTELIDDSVEPYTLCRKCGAIARGEDEPYCRCGKINYITIYKVDPRTKAERKKDIPAEAAELRRCVSCGARSNNGIIFRFLTGKDAPVSVLATSFYQNLPPASDPNAAILPGEGRKLLTFADSRQDAAFFAPYMERTYQNILRRRLILKSILEDEMGREGRLRLQDVTSRLLRQAEAANLFKEEQSFDDRKILCNTWLMQEFIAIDRRNSLEGLGLLQFRLIQPKNWLPPAPLLSAPWNLSKEQVWDLISFLLDTLRQQGAVTFPDSVEPRDEAFEPRNKALYVRLQNADPKPGIFGWMPNRGKNRRIDILEKLLAENGIHGTEANRLAMETLEGIWRHLTEPNSVWKRHFISENLRKHGVVYRLNHSFWELLPTGTVGQNVYRCQKCHSISYTNVNGICSTYKCHGTVMPIQVETAFADNHYRHLYQTLKPIPFTAKEHTAQWRSEIATQIQDEFVRGELNALSCSTTFELGVDVGELQAVLMRNVPPTTANYVQRAGRAGRRTDSAAFTLTFAQRRSHDLTYYANPVDIVAGKITTPSINITNEKIVRRHMHSVLFAEFFRFAKAQSEREFRRVGDFFNQGATQPSGVDMLRQFSEKHPHHIKEALERIVPPELQKEFGLTTWQWLNYLWQNDENDSDIQPILETAQAEIADDIQTLEALELEAVKDRKYWLAENFRKVAKTIEGRALLGFLGSRNVLPKYGFPTDVVELRTTFSQAPEANNIELTRDLQIAIAEYAPGAQVVAAKRVWTSGGIYMRPGHEWVKYTYAICPQCRRFNESIAKKPTQKVSVCQCGAKTPINGTYIIPEFGFIVSTDPPAEAKEKRPSRAYSSQVYFAKYQTPNSNSNTPSDPAPEWLLEESLSSDEIEIRYRYSRYGLLTMVNSGPTGVGYRVCQYCGYSEPVTNRYNRRKLSKKDKTHKNPRTGKDCRGFFETLHLGHKFTTDVLELQFRGAFAQHRDWDEWLSILYAILEGASDGLGIKRDDLNATIYWNEESQSHSLVFYDTVPGGAGHVSQISQKLPVVLNHAYKRVATCECGEETSCYNCLRNYRNQHVHTSLKRGIARDFLGYVLSEKAYH